MPKVKDDGLSDFLEFLYSALAAEIGVAVATSQPQAAVQKFNKARRASGDPELEIISIRVSPFLPEEEVWLIKKNVKKRD